MTVMALARACNNTVDKYDIDGVVYEGLADVPTQDKGKQVFWFELNTYEGNTTLYITTQEYQDKQVYGRA